MHFRPMEPRVNMKCREAESAPAALAALFQAMPARDRRASNVTFALLGKWSPWQGSDMYCSRQDACDALCRVSRTEDPCSLTHAVSMPLKSARQDVMTELNVKLHCA